MINDNDQWQSHLVELGSLRHDIYLVILVSWIKKSLQYARLWCVGYTIFQSICIEVPITRAVKFSYLWTLFILILQG